MGADATHMTGSDPAGATLRYLLQKVVAARPVDLIHGHGTGTTINDPVELAAFDDLCDSADHPSPVVYSHKGALGHSLGASGLVSVALNCMMHRRGIALPNVQTRRPLPTRGLHINPQPLERRIRRSIAAAAGFGGPTAVVSLV
jgi:3-oxoacyl-[acyl-carrier-protein] synthase II